MTFVTTITIFICLWKAGCCFHFLHEPLAANHQSLIAMIVARGMLTVIDVYMYIYTYIHIYIYIYIYI